VTTRAERDRTQLSALLESDRPIACVVQGGGMRGTYSIAALAEFERLGYTNRFSTVYGASAGALNGAYFLAGQAAEGVGIYVDHLSTGRFINFARRRVIDIDYLIDDVLTLRVPLNQEAVLASRTDLLVYLTNAVTGGVERFSMRDRQAPLMELLRATAALPLVYGKEVTINSTKYVDGGFVDQVPLLDALADGCRNIVVILTRPPRFRMRDASPLMRWVLRSAASLSGHSAGVVRLIGTDCGPMNKVMAILSGEPHDMPANVWVIAPPDDEQIVSRLTSDRARLQDTARKAQVHVQNALSAAPVMTGG
jgi:predicted patatin/cPLA2 family phospholipase